MNDEHGKTKQDVKIDKMEVDIKHLFFATNELIKTNITYPEIDEKINVLNKNRLDDAEAFVNILKETSKKIDAKHQESLVHIVRIGYKIINMQDILILICGVKIK